MHKFVKVCQTFVMKTKLMTAICILSAAATMLCGCNDGQTGGGQNLNDGPDTRIVEPGKDSDGEHVLPDVPVPAPDDPKPHGDHRRDDRIPPPEKGERLRPRRIFGHRNGDNCRCPDCGNDEKDDCPEIMPQPEEGN